MNIIDIKNCNVYLKENQVLHDFSLQVENLEHTAIIGPNGSGKSTFIRLLIKDLYPSRFEEKEPEMKILGRDDWGLFELRRMIALVSPKFTRNLMTALPLNVFNAVSSSFLGTYGFFAHDKNTDEQIQMTHQILDALNLTSLKDRSINELSTGQLRKVLIARALVLQPKIMLLDEPTTGLDIKAQYEFLRFIDNAVKKTTLLLVTHHLEEVIPAIKKVLLIKEGRIFRFGDKQEVLNAKNLSELFDMDIKLNISADGIYSMRNA